MARMKRREISALAVELADWTRHLVNGMLGRRLRGSNELAEEIQRAIDDGYGEADLRIAVRSAVGGRTWLSKQLTDDAPPALIFRHNGGLNPETGRPAARWLDRLIESAQETDHGKLRACFERLYESNRNACHREVAAFREAGMYPPKLRQLPGSDPIAEGAWADIRGEIEADFRHQGKVANYATWFRPTRGISVGDGLLVVACASAIAAETISRGYAGLVAAAVAKRGLELRVRFVAGQ